MPSDFSQNQDVMAEEFSPIVILRLNLPRGYRRSSSFTSETIDR